MLTAEQQARRAGKVTASFAPYLMAADEKKLLNEWFRLVEHPNYVEEDLSHHWPVILGTVIEGPALDYHEWKTGQPLTDRGQWVNHPQLAHVGCTLDAYRVADQSVIDCKAPGRWRKLEDVLDYYPAQLVVQRACVNAKRAALLVVHGGDEPVEHEVTWDAEYEGEVWSRIDWFWRCVETLQPPSTLATAKAPVPAIRQVDMSKSNSWCAFAEGWLSTRAAATAFKDAEKGIKSLVEEDVARAFGHGIICTRNRAGSLSIKELR